MKRTALQLARIAARAFDLVLLILALALLPLVDMATHADAAVGPQARADTAWPWWGPFAAAVVFVAVCAWSALCPWGFAS